MEYETGRRDEKMIEEGTGRRDERITCYRYVSQNSHTDMLPNC